MLKHTFFTENRQRIWTSIPEYSMLLISANEHMPKSADQTFPFYQNSDFYFLTGLLQENSILCLYKKAATDPPGVILWIRKPSPELEIWTGHRYTKEEANKISGIEQIFHYEDFEVMIKEYFVQFQDVYLLLNESTKFLTDFATANDLLLNKLQKTYPLHTFHRLAPLMADLRLIKQKEEMEMIHQAISITGKALHRVLKEIQAGMYEYQVSASITHEILINGSSGHAFESIVASGKNACVLHYTTAESVMKDGDLVLMDFGAEYCHYAADCSRTVPVNGRFSQRQIECYEAVLRVFKKAQKLYVPGNTILNINNQVNEWMEQEMITLGLFSQSDVKTQHPDAPLYRKYFMHGTAHYIGLDVHDVGNRNAPLQKGMVLSCEPGLYIASENIGIRIETMMLIGEQPIDLMKDFPVEIDEIEKLMDK